MNLKKLALWLFIIGTFALVVGIVVGAITFDIEEFKSQVGKVKTIGGEKDEGGCYISAGYSWCEVKDKCVREWEEPCE